MANYNGARRKTSGNRNGYLPSSESGGRSKQNSTNDGWGNIGRRPSRSTSNDSRGDYDRRMYSKDEDGWGVVDRRPSNYTSDDLWSPLPSKQAVQDNAWEKRGSRKNQKPHTNQGKKPTPLVGANFSWNDEDYPVLERRQQPTVNVWEKRKEKLEGRKAMEPTNQTEEEIMIQKAIELSKREAMEMEERRRLIEEEYAMQNEMLAANPEFFSEFLTPDELAATNKSSEPQATEYNDFPDDHVEKESIWDYSEPVESNQPQKQSKISGRKKKRNKSRSSPHAEDDINSQNAWSDSYNKQNDSVLPQQTEYQGNWSSNYDSNNYCNDAEEDVFQYTDKNSEYRSGELKSTITPEADDEGKIHKDSHPKISKVIDRFGGWGSKNTQNSIRKSSLKEESYDNFSSNSNDKEVYEDGWENSNEASEVNENLQFLKSSSNQWEANDCSTNEKDQASLNQTDSWNTEYSSNNKRFDSESKPSLYSHVESNIAASASSSFCYAATNSSDTGDSYLSKKSVPKEADTIISIVQDYASLAINCSNSTSKGKVPVQRKPKDILSNVTTLLNEDNINIDLNDLQHSSVGENQNLATPIGSQLSKNEITYSLSNAAETANENIVEWNDSKIGFPTNPEINEVNDSLFSSRINEPVINVPNSHEGIPVDPAIPAPVQPEAHFPCQPNPVMPTLMNPNFMMGMNPLLMQQQMMMLSNPFFLQQLHQMEMYYRSMSMPFNTPLIPPMATPGFNPMVNTMGSIFNGEPSSCMNAVPEHNMESIPPILPPCHKFEDENHQSIPIRSDPPKTSTVPNVEFENSWLSDLLSEGAAHMDSVGSYIPPPTLPASRQSENPQSMPNVENRVEMNVAQDILQSAVRNESIPQNSNCDTKSLRQESSALKHGRPDASANRRNVSIPNSSVPEASGWGNIDDTPEQNRAPAAEASGWGDIDDAPKKNSWDDDVDGWAEEKDSSPKSMINSSRYASHKQATVRQPVRQPRQTSKWR